MDIESSLVHRLSCILVLHPELIYIKIENHQCILSFKTDAIRDILRREFHKPRSIGEVQIALRQILNDKLLKIRLLPKAPPFGGFDEDGYDVGQAFEIKVKHSSSKKAQSHTDSVKK